MSLVYPLKQSDGTRAVDANSLGLGSVTLTSGTRYILLLGGIDQTVIGAHVQWDASIVITTITVESCSLPEEAFASDANKGSLSTTAGVWIDEDPSTAFVGTVGAGVTVTNGVVAVAGGAAGGCHFHIADTGAQRTRLNILVGGTGGVIRCGANLKKK
jgi:hypothetical protein